jgi:hypothetical protein
VVLCDARLHEIKELCRYALADKDYRDGHIQGRIDTFYWAVDRNRIYVNTCGEGYEIQVFDLEGALVRRIRKEYLPVAYPEQYKRSFREAWNRLPQVHIDFPRFLPPCHALFSDERGRLYVQTFEPGKKPGTWIHDIFDADGVFIGRQSLEIAWRGGSLGLHTHALARHGRLYCLVPRGEGRFALAVYLMFT